MIADIKQAIVEKLKELYPNHMRYMDDISQNDSLPAFVIFQLEQTYEKRLNTKNNGSIRFDIAYFSDKPATEIMSDCQMVQGVLLREFDLVGTFRAINKKAQITDSVLHFTFHINYSEMKVKEGIAMKKQQTNTEMEG